MRTSCFDLISSFIVKTNTAFYTHGEQRESDIQKRSENDRHHESRGNREMVMTMTIVEGGTL